MNSPTLGDGCPRDDVDETMGDNDGVESGEEEETQDVAFVTATETTKYGPEESRLSTPSQSFFLPNACSTSTPAARMHFNVDNSIDKSATDNFHDFQEDDLSISAIETSCNSESSTKILSDLSSTSLNRTPVYETSSVNSSLETKTSGTILDESDTDTLEELPQKSSSGIDYGNILSETNDTSTPVNDTDEVTTKDEEESSTTLYENDEKDVLTLPTTCTVLTSDKTGGKLYLIGTAHFSKESQDDVTMVIRGVQPDVVVLELCKDRTNILTMDEETILKQEQNFTTDKIIATIRQKGATRGLMYVLLLYLSVKLTKELGMAPGGEFRRAFQEAQKIPGCGVQLGDRPVHITLNRAFSSLSLWQKLKFGFLILTNKEPVTAEEVERYKQKDILRSVLEECAGDFPELTRVIVQERDVYLANTLRMAVDGQILPPPGFHSMSSDPRVVVGVVGMGHVDGIVGHWDKTNPEELRQLVQIPPRSLAERATVTTIRLSLLSLGAFAVYRVLRTPARFLRTKFF